MGECKRRQLRVRPAPGEKPADTAAEHSWRDTALDGTPGRPGHGAMATKQTPPDAYICPITSEMMSDPVSTSDGFTYEREAILEWLRSGNTTSPLSGAVLERNDLVPNHGAHSPCHHSILRVLALRSTLVEPRSCHSLRRTHHPHLPRSAAGCYPTVC